MRQFFATLALALYCAFTSLTAQINTVNHTPNPAYSTNVVSLIVNYTFYSSCDKYVGAYVQKSGNTFSVYIDMDLQPGNCIFVVTTGNLPAISLGSLSAGSYTANFYNHDTGNFLQSYSFTVLAANGTGYSCSSPIVLTCGQTYNGSNISGTNNWSTYRDAAANIVFSSMTGKDKKHVFTLATASTVTIKLFGIQTGMDLDLILNSACSANNILSWSGNSGNADETITIALTAGTYRIIVDGFQGGASNYSLSLTCTGTTTGCSAPSASEVSVSQISTTSALFSCSKPGSFYQFAYRPLAGGTWKTPAYSSANTLLVSDLTACTAYEVQAAVFCNGAWSNYSTSKTFTTNCLPVGPTNDDACGATVIAAKPNCEFTLFTTIGSTPSTQPSLPSTCLPPGPIHDVWVQTTIPTTGKLNVFSAAGTITDAVVAVYWGESCNALNFLKCFDDNPNGSLMPNFSVTGQVGTKIWMRYYNYGSSTGTFSVCAVAATLFANSGNGQNEIAIPIGNEVSDRAELFENDAAKQIEKARLKAFPVPATDQITIEFLTGATENSASFFVLAADGRVLRSIQNVALKDGQTNQNIEVADLPNGSYTLRAVAGNSFQTLRFVKID